MKLINHYLIFLFLIFFSSFCRAAEIDDNLQEIFKEIENKNWNLSMELLLDKPEGNAEVNLLWALWYGDRDNPSYDNLKSTKSLEIATRLGSKDAQLLLIGKYLFTDDPEVTNYTAGVKLGEDLRIFYEKKLNQGKDPTGELHRIVGKFYVFGIGVKKDPKYGMELIKKAAELGDLEAKRTLR